MGATLVMIERACRGTVEQQYAHVLWLAHGLHTQSPLTVLLRGPAAVYALASAMNAPVTVAGAPWGAAPDYRAAIGRLRADGAEVFVSASALKDLGVSECLLLPGIKVLGDEEITAVVSGCDRWWFL